jgi:hypothetical protein
MHPARGEPRQRVEAGQRLVDRETLPKRCCRASAMALPDCEADMRMFRCVEVRGLLS